MALSVEIIPQQKCIIIPPDLPHRRHHLQLSPQTFLTGVLIFTLGSIGRIVCRKSFTSMFAWTVVAQIAQPFLQCLSAALPTLYFPANRRSLATALGVVADFFGVGCGMFVAGMFRSDPSDFILFGGLMLLIGLALYVPVFLFVTGDGGLCWRVERRIPGAGREEHEEQGQHLTQEMADVVSSHPSISEQQSDPYLLNNIPPHRSDNTDDMSRRSDNMWMDIVVLFRKCPMFTWSFLGVSIIFGIFNCTLAIIDQILPNGASGPIYAACFFSGCLIGNAIQGIMLDMGLSRTVLEYFHFPHTEIIPTHTPSW